MYQVQKPVKTKEELQGLLAEMHPSQVNKIIDHIDAHVSAWLAHTTFVTIASTNARG